MSSRSLYRRAFPYSAADAGVPGFARPPELHITTPDPRFDPHRPVAVNGYRFVPACRPYTAGDPPFAEALQVENDAELVEYRNRAGFAHGLILGLLLAPLLWLALVWAVQGWGGGFYG